MHIKKTVISVAVLSFILTFSSEAHSCLCPGMKVKDRIKSMKVLADAVFIGKVVNVVTEVEPVVGDGTPIRELPIVKSRTAEFIIEKTWKPVSSDRATIPFAIGGCSVWFEKDKTYVVYAKLDDSGVLQTNMCMGTGPIELSEDDLKYLGRPLKEFPKPAESGMIFSYPRWEYVYEKPFAKITACYSGAYDPIFRAG